MMTMNDRSQYSVLCDTNVLIYYMLGMPPFFFPVLDLFKRSAEWGVQLSCTALSLKDVFYITPGRFKDRYLHDESLVVQVTAQNMLPRIARASVSQLLKIMTVLPVGAEECFAADGMYGTHPDFEDNLVIAAAEHAGVRYVATYDKQLIRHYPGLCDTPEEIVQHLSSVA